jgi:hypothetical protein
LPKCEGAHSVWKMIFNTCLGLWKSVIYEHNQKHIPAYSLPEQNRPISFVHKLACHVFRL